VVAVVGTLHGAIVYVVLIFYMMNSTVHACKTAQIWSSSGFSLLCTQLQILCIYGILVAPWPTNLLARLASTGTLFVTDIDWIFSWARCSTFLGTLFGNLGHAVRHVREMTGSSCNSCCIRFDTTVLVPALCGSS